MLLNIKSFLDGLKLLYHKLSRIATLILTNSKLYGIILKDRGAVLISTLRFNRSECSAGERQRRRKSGFQTGLLLVAELNKAVTVIGRVESYRQ